MRRTRLGLAVALAGTLAVAGCGNAPGPSGSGGTGGLPDLSGQRLEVIGTWSAAEQAAFAAVLKNFTDKTHAQVTYPSGGDNTPVLINSRLAGGSPPDVAALSYPGVVAGVAQKGQIKPLGGAAPAPGQADFSAAPPKLGQGHRDASGLFFKVGHKAPSSDP